MILAGGLLVIRPWLPADRPAVLAIAEAVWPSSPESDEAFCAKADAGVLLVAEIHGDVIGYGIAMTWAGSLPVLDAEPADSVLPVAPGSWWHVHDIAVLPADRRLGAGTALLDALLHHGVQRGLATARAVAVTAEGRTMLHRAGFTVESSAAGAPPRGYPTGAEVLCRALDRWHVSDRSAPSAQ